MRWTSRIGTVSVVLETPVVMRRHYTGARTRPCIPSHDGHHGDGMTRRRFMRAALIASVLRPLTVVAQDGPIVEDWRAPAGTAAQPPGGRPHETPGGGPSDRFTLV